MMAEQPGYKGVVLVLQFLQRRRETWALSLTLSPLHKASRMEASGSLMFYGLADVHLGA